MRTRITTLLLVLLMCAIPAFGAISVASSPSDSSILVQRTGQLSWTLGSAVYLDRSSPLSPTTLTLDPDQQANLNSRMNELVVHFAEEAFKNKVLKNVIKKHMLSGASLVVVMLNDRLALLDPLAGQLYDSDHVQVTQTMLVTQTNTDCGTGSICFDAKMYGINGNVIQRGTVIIFPPWQSSFVVVLGGDAG